jgi:CRP/FNR family transcriptional regulator, cyclic AMP receptor protein
MISPLLGKVLEEYNEGNNRIGLVEFGGKRRSIYLNLVPEAHTGDYVRFLAGFATERVNENDAPPVLEQPGGSEEDEDPAPDLRTDKAYRLLSELDPQQLRKLIPLAQDKRFAAGQIIFHAGENSLFLHLIVSGDVALEELTGDRPVHVQTLHAGDAMGWSALMAAARTHFQARALSRVSTIAFPSDQIRAACDRDPAMGYQLMKRLMELVTERLDAVRMKLAGYTKPEELR